jgi:sialidase-1
MSRQAAAMALLLWAASLVSAAPEAPPEAVCVFPGTPGNRPNHRIPALIQAPNGDLLVICEKRNDGIGDIGNHDLVLKRSTDLGRTWGPEEIILDDGGLCCADPTVGRIGDRL